MITQVFDTDYEVTTPYGKGLLFMSTNYGANGSTTFTVILHTGYLVECPMADIRFGRNFTFGRGNKEDLKRILEEKAS